jgi:hypothetical protein
VDDLQTTDFRVDWHLVPEVRKIVSARVRLSFTERSRWLGFVVVFTVSGPQSVVEAVGKEIDGLQLEDWYGGMW